jgi:hypothetical protein
VKLDFIVIGAARSGTTSLWEYLRPHPEIWMPPGKEEPFFSEDQRYARGLPWLMDEVFGRAPADAVLGKVTPQYMSGTEECPPQICAGRIAADLPDVKLVALLRDPVERALSQYRQARRQGDRLPSFEAVASALLDPAWLHAARTEPRTANRFVVNGEYGRILAAYHEALPREQLLVIFTDELADDPGGVLDRVCDFVGVERFRPDDLGGRHNRAASRLRVPAAALEELIGLLRQAPGNGNAGGDERREVLEWLDSSPEFGESLDPGARGQLEAKLESEVWSREPVRGRRHHTGIEFWLRNTWNLIPDEDDPGIEPEAREALREHYRPDLEVLAELLGIEPPWDWVASRAGLT